VIVRRSPVGTVVHSDRGSQFRWTAFVRTLATNDRVVSMGRVGACGDNAAMESFDRDEGGDVCPERRPIVGRPCRRFRQPVQVQR
jgi:transposase InsO family protein